MTQTSLKLAAISLLALAPALSAEPDSLKEQLDARAAQSATTATPEVKAAYAQGIEVVAASGLIKDAMKVGDTAPDFTLTNADGKEVALSALLKEGPVILTWYRGGWCPYCNIALAAMEKKLPEFRKAGAQLVALTPELPDKSLTTTEKNKLTFQVLTDKDHAVARKFGIAFDLTPEVRELYKKHFNLTEFNGATAGDGTLPLAATYIIDRKGVIRWAFLDADYRKRAEPADLVTFLEKNPL